MEGWLTNYLCSQANVRQYYQQFEEQQTQSLIDQKVKEHLGQTAAALAQQQVGGAVYSHLATLQGGQYKPSPGLLQRPPLPTMRPPVLAPPSGPSPGTVIINRLRMYGYIGDPNATNACKSYKGTKFYS